MAWLLDTNILSELRYGIELVTDATRRADLSEWLDNIIRPMFGERVVSITEDIMVKWRIMVEEGRKNGHTFSQPDLIIAASAAHHGMTVVTRDRKQFDKARVPVVNPWSL